MVELAAAGQLTYSFVFISFKDFRMTALKDLRA
jgi:hypothetical protein